MRSLESNLQIACIEWFRLQYPKYSKLLFSVPNGGSRNVIEAKRLKREGVVAGVADILFLKPNKDYPFLCIEMKHGKGKQSENQKEWQKEVEAIGGKYVVCNSFELFKKEIEEYLKNINN